MKTSNFQLINKPRVTKCFFEANRDFDFSDEVPLEINNNVKIGRNLDEEKMEAVVVLNLGFFTKSDFNKVPFKIEIEVEGIFKWDEDLKNNKLRLESLLKENAPAILYSYLRPIITQMTVEANLPPLIIPLMNFRK
ncbi:protein-export chaperone SecB [Anaerosalibacter bizertensis]|uniref:protein-export chaperone SecB n=1 Tax=Anaerosalibacter bizertensis TaxID=932217 RepID=UPI001C0ED45E|nr:protein-export chaperone SecB [Anaerosalibacter bizertensis]MBU5294774.1 protein-export chaperone SecB [Anaerosalibacter bizertensis]